MGQEYTAKNQSEMDRRKHTCDGREPMYGIWDGCIRATKGESLGHGQGQFLLGRTLTTPETPSFSGPGSVCFCAGILSVLNPLALSLSLLLPWFRLAHPIVAVSETG